MAVQRLTDLSGIRTPSSSTSKLRAIRLRRPSTGLGGTRRDPRRVQETVRKYNPPVDQPARPLELEEYRQLRTTIRERGSLRVVLFVVTMLVWAVVAGLVGTFISLPLASLLPLLVLVSGFEAVHQLHIGVERIGRYLSVRYESEIGRPMWEAAIAAFGSGHRPSTRPAGALFAPIFVAAIVATFLLSVLGATPWEMLGIGAIHALAILRIVTARSAAARQRAEDQKRFEATVSRSSPPAQ